MISSLEDISLNSNICFAGEVGLSGEIRSIQRAEQRIQEANRLGFKQIFVPKFNMKGIDPKNYDVEIIAVGKLEEIYNLLFA